MPGGSRAAQRRERKRAKASGAAVPEAPSNKCARTQASACSAATHDEPAAPAVHEEPVAAFAINASGAPSAEAGAAPSPQYREWQIPAPNAANDDGLYEALQIAVDQAATIHGRKYRYGALLIAGDDHVPLKSGSNKKPFLRDNIHAEMSVLKGCPRPAGKDMFIARLAPTAPPAEGAAAPSATPAGRRKILNAMPCDRCEAKMIRTGIRHCYFTINATTIGVRLYNADDRDGV
mmetsp:Transcript_7086/g.22427  ORF Transcript_7086/g.22427 Transcript_7086/m.22427 type:complete len:234 (-) Transcript_7086:116-817(-)